jgi:hypothetical protein
MRTSIWQPPFPGGHSSEPGNGTWGVDISTMRSGAAFAAVRTVRFAARDARQLSVIGNEARDAAQHALTR